MGTKQFRVLKELSKAELATKLRETESQLFQARMKKVTGQLKDTASLKRFRKDLARMRMLMANVGTNKSPKVSSDAAQQSR